ncbi:putative secreted protein (Por secretion system target) [Lutibacter sp. Hel_I_33_5]|uniref:T9SS type A sorting domain-containing protein n=1 Tax=Lutibacter sp. Hel_I_33_5 TaxID=1566289 RepID=UPI0011A4E2BA|nr:T9SS type A sorting domain-containing protein [Lutibacter sp. Hel_I_33_5]TVZ54990.1 putative secreted protein (Por secretion system target) [Lutibacter sp. Hel_I_33_5]
MKKLSLTLLFLFTINSFSQTDSGNLENYLHAKIAAMPGETGNNFSIPTDNEVTSWTAMINSILSNDIATARTNATSVNYQIVEYTDTDIGNNDVFYVVEEKSPQSKYWGTFAFAKNAARPNLILQAPHSDFDFNTGKQAIYCFVRLNNKALFLNGTHRCNHSTLSTCAGTTTVCTGGSSEAFKISDMAHNAETMWQKTTEIIYNTITESVFFQLHGFAKKDDDPYVILSNGTDQTPTTDYAAQLKTALFAQDNTLTFKTAHLDNWDRLVGFTNTQGRLINQSNNPCNQSAQSTTGRFIHVEQEKTKLRADSTGWEKMYQALVGVFGVLMKVEDFVQIKMKSENPFKNSLTFSAENMQNILIYDILGKTIYQNKNTKELNRFTIDTKSFSNGIYFLKVTTNKGTDIKKLLRE